MIQIKGLLVGAIVVLLSACSATNNSGNFSSPPPINTGIVVAEILNNSRYIPKAALGWTRIFVNKVDEATPKLYSLNVTKRFDLRPKLKYAGALPPGKYEIIELYYFKQTDGYVAESVAFAPAMLGQFEVKANEITNLGTLIYHPLFTPHFLDEGEIGSHSLAREENPRLPELVGIELDNWIGTATHSNYNGWLTDNSEPIRSRTLNSMKSADLPSAVSEFKDQPILFGKLGGVYYQVNESWHYANLNVNGVIIDGAQAGDDGFLIGTSENNLYMLQNAFFSRSLVKTFTSEKLEKVMRHQAQTYVFTLTDDKVLNVYQFDSKHQLPLIKSFPLHELPGSTKRQRLSSFSVDGKMQIRIGKNLISYAPSNQIWNVKATDEDLLVYTENNHVVIAAEPSSWSGITDTKYSTDGGASWHQTKVKESNLYLDSDGALYYVADGYTLNLLLGSSILEQVPVHKSTDKGRSWSIIGNLPTLCDQFLSNQSSDQAFWVLCSNGDVMLSKDKGKNWETSFTRKKLIPSDFPANTVLP